MKNKKILLMILAVALVLGMTACGGGGSSGGSGGGSNTELGAITYSGINGSDVYTLTVSQSSARAAYSPKNGDTYYLIIVTDYGYYTSTGTVTLTGNAFTLSKGGVVTVSDNAITGITGKITLDQGGTNSPSSDSWTPTGIVDTSLNGTWVNGSYTVKVNNGTYEYTGKVPYEKGTFITDSSTKLNVIPTHYWGKSYESELQAKWYTMGELLVSYPDYESTIRSYYRPYTVTYISGGSTITFHHPRYGSGTFTKK